MDDSVGLGGQYVSIYLGRLIVVGNTLPICTLEQYPIFTVRNVCLKWQYVSWTVVSVRSRDGRKYKRFCINTDYDIMIGAICYFLRL